MVEAPHEGEQQTTEAHVSDAPKGHEQSDVALRPLIIIAGILVVGAVVVHVLMWLAMVSFERDERSEHSPVSPVADARPRPSEPRLQPTIDYHPTLPYEDVAAMQRANREVLTTPGWVDRQRGIVRIPIERAMRQLARESQPGATTQEVAK